MAVDAVRAKLLFLAASDISNPEVRSAYLERECGDDDQLRARVEALLAVEDASSITPSEGQAATSDSESPPMTEHRSQFEPGDVIAGRYTLREKIGEGGMGEVWAAKQSEPVKRIVALKLIKPGMDSRAVVTRFEQERQALAMMDHPNISRVLDGGLTATGQPFFVMELVNGLPLTNFCDEARLSTKQRLELFLPICQAVQHAHQKGIVHRDLKPANILVTLVDDKPVPKVIDFGVAKAIGGKLTHEPMTKFGAVVGTLEYMAPEQAGFSATDVDTRADIYSLGVMLYELLTGLRPFDTARLQKAAMMEMIRIIFVEEVTKPSARLSTDHSLPSLAAVRGLDPDKLTAQLRGELDCIVMKALEKDRSRRYETASGFGMDVSRYLAGEPVLAVPPSASYRVLKFARKHQTVLTGAAVILFLLVAGLAGTAWQAKRASEQRDVANKARDSETHQRRIAESERDKARIIVEFISETLKGVGPGVAMGRDITMLREMMDIAAARINAGELKAAPEAELRLRSIIGTVYMDLALYAESATMFEPALSLARMLHVGDHIDTAGALNNLGLLSYYRGDMTRSGILHREALAIYQRLFPGDHPEVARCLDDLGATVGRQGDSTGAVELFRGSLEMYKRLDLGDNSDFANAINNYSVALYKRGEREESERLLKDATDMWKRLNSGDHPRLAVGLSNLAYMYHSRGDLVGAESLFREALEMKRRLYKTDHPTVAASLRNLAFWQSSRGDLDAAEKQYLESLDMYRRLFPADHPDVAEVLGELFGVYEAREEFEKAERCLVESMEMKKRLNPGDRHEVARDLTNLASIVEASGDAERAVPLAREGLAMWQRLYPGGHPETAWGLRTLASALTKTGRYAEAEPLIESSIEMYTAQNGSTDRKTSKALAIAARLYESWEQADPGKGHGAKAAALKARLEATAPLESPPGKVP